MTLKSALEDLLATTLASVSGIVGKLDYVATLRGAGGMYSHWGLSRVHGEGAAQQALAEAHRLLFLKLLRTSLRTLRNELTASSSARQMSPLEYVESLHHQALSLLPDNLGGGSVRHFNSVLRALSSLEKSRLRANLPS